MIITIQRWITGLPYSVNKQEFSTDWMSKEQIIEEIITARAISDRIEETYWSISPLDIQLAEDNKMYKKLNEKLQVASEQKSVFIKFLKEELGDRFEDIKTQCLESADYKKVTAHTNDSAE